MLRVCEWCNNPATVFTYYGQAVCLCGSCHRRRVDRIKRITEAMVREVQQQIVDDCTANVEPCRRGGVVVL